MRSIALSVAILLFISCGSKQGVEEQTIKKRKFSVEKNPVDIIILNRSNFQKELISNGKLTARSKSVLKFGAGEVLEYLNVKNGDLVKTGAVIARLNQDRSRQQLEQAKLSLEQATIELQNLLIGLNYSLSDSGRIPRKSFETACIQSGYSAARSRFATAQLDYNATELRAPYCGLIANLKYKINEQVSSGSEFCTLIDNSLFEVNFPILESELLEVSLGKDVKVIPFAWKEKAFKGKISEINPTVDESGMIQLTATLEQKGQLMDGMNVQVLVENVVSSQLVVPKPAVVLRDNQEVLFKIVAGKAFWTYVNILSENSDSYSVIANTDKGATLEPGDTVIISGNLNLAHESEVIIK